jgi:hypothetical protein
MPKTFKKWCDEHRKGLKRSYKQRAECELTLGFQDWAAQFYKIYVGEFRAAA